MESFKFLADVASLYLLTRLVSEAIHLFVSVWKYYRHKEDYAMVQQLLSSVEKLREEK